MGWDIYTQVISVCFQTSRQINATKYFKDEFKIFKDAVWIRRTITNALF